MTAIVYAWSPDENYWPASDDAADDPFSDATAEYGLVRGELGADHVLLTGDGQPVIIDIEGLAYFDVEWEHAFLRLRFRPGDYRLLDLPEPDEARVAFYLLAQRIALIEGPLRIAQTDSPDREWMLDLADFHIAAVLAQL
jgi:hypothetical protein